MALRLLVRMLSANGTRLMDEGDLLAAFRWFVEALKLDERNPLDNELYRLRVATVLCHTPKLAQVWFHDRPVWSLAFSRDSRHVAFACEDGAARLCDVKAGDAR